MNKRLTKNEIANARIRLYLRFEEEKERTEAEVRRRTRNTRKAHTIRDHGRTITLIGGRFGTFVKVS